MTMTEATSTRTLCIGPLQVDPPVVLAPMAGVTNAPFRSLCRRSGAGLYVSEMLMARAVALGNDKTLRMASFEPDETPRSAQLYATDPVSTGEAVRILINESHVDHIDMNFGCPVPKVTSKGGGSAIPARPALLRTIIAAAVSAAEAESGSRVPVTIKFRIGLNDDIHTHLSTGRIAEEEGVKAIALHARTTQQFYSGYAQWEEIAALKAHVTTIPVLGNGDIWHADDALRMMAETGCDGVVVGRGCLGRPWLFRDLADAFAGRPIQPAPLLDEALAVLREHADLLAVWFGEQKGMRELRKHCSWYLTGYPVGSAVRQSLGLVSSLNELDDLLAALDPTAVLVPGSDRLPRGRTSGPRPVVLPQHWLDHPDDPTPPIGADEAHSGG